MDLCPMAQISERSVNKFEVMESTGKIKRSMKVMGRKRGWESIEEN
jgi:hypothetical protein